MSLTPTNSSIVTSLPNAHRESDASIQSLPPASVQAAQESARRADRRESMTRARAKTESAVTIILENLETEFGPSTSNSHP